MSFRREALLEQPVFAFMVYALQNSTSELVHMAVTGHFTAGEIAEAKHALWALWKRNIRCKITPISVLSRRMCAIILTINNFDIILFIVYMPCDTLYVHNNQLQYNELFHEISHACTDHNVHQIIVGGYFNTDFSHQASLYTKFLTAYMDNDFLKNVYIHILSKIDYTYCSKINKERSCIDHFLLSDNLFNIICQYE